MHHRYLYIFLSLLLSGVIIADFCLTDVHWAKKLDNASDRYVVSQAVFSELQNTLRDLSYAARTYVLTCDKDLKYALKYRAAHSEMAAWASGLAERPESMSAELYTGMTISQIEILREEFDLSPEALGIADVCQALSEKQIALENQAIESVFNNKKERGLHDPEKSSAATPLDFAREIIEGREYWSTIKKLEQEFHRLEIRVEQDNIKRLDAAQRKNTFISRSLSLLGLIICVTLTFLVFLNLGTKLSKEQEARMMSFQLEQNLREVLEIAQMGYWTYKTVNNRYFATEYAQRFLGLPDGDLNVSGDQWLESVHPDDRAECAEEWRNAIDSATVFDFTGRLAATSTLPQRYFHCIGKPHVEEDTDDHVDFLGFVQKVTRAKYLENIINRGANSQEEEV